MIQFSRAPIRNTRSASRNAVLRAAPTDNGSSSGMVPLPIGEFRNGSWVRWMNSRMSSSARDHAMPLPTTTSGLSAASRAPSAASTASGSALRARRFRHPCRLGDVAFFAFGADDVVREVEIDRAGAPVQRVANGLIDVVRDAMRMLDGVRVLAVGRGPAPPGAPPGKPPMQFW